MQSHDTLPNSLARPDMQFETRLEAAARERRERTAATEALHAEAKAKGELWTAHAALYPDRVACFVYNGCVPVARTPSAEHPDCGLFMGPCYLTGNQQAVMAEALALFRVDEITIRVIR